MTQGTVQLFGSVRGYLLGVLYVANFTKFKECCAVFP
jgi:hypothetical protein